MIPIGIPVIPENSMFKNLYGLIMKKVFKDYSDHVLETYRDKKLKNPPFWPLANPSPAKIRDECLNVYRNRYSKKDEEFLKSFFGETNSREDCLRKIEHCDINKLKPLKSFIKGDTENPGHIIIELLAWLLDVQPRPSDRWIEAGGPTVQPPGESTGSKPEKLGADEKQDDSGNPYSKSKTFVVIASAIEVTVVCVLIWLGMSKFSGPILTGHEKCMYWKEDHYEPVSCSQKIDGALIVALDSSRLTNFRKITRWDTITKKDIGKVWYIKHNNRLEYFTDSGAYPLDIKFRVRPITDYIIDKYILNNQASD